MKQKKLKKKKKLVFRIYLTFVRDQRTGEEGEWVKNVASYIVSVIVGKCFQDRK